MSKLTVVDKPLTNEEKKALLGFYIVDVIPYNALSTRRTIIRICSDRPDRYWMSSTEFTPDLTNKEILKSVARWIVKIDIENKFVNHKTSDPTGWVDVANELNILRLLKEYS